MKGIRESLSTATILLCLVLSGLAHGQTDARTLATIRPEGASRLSSLLPYSPLHQRQQGREGHHHFGTAAALLLCTYIECCASVSSRVF